LKIPPFKTVLIGFGMSGAGYAEDPVMGKYFRYATHAQVLADHPLFSWQAVVDLSETALKAARDKWNIPVTVKSMEALLKRLKPDVAVIATPPEHRIEVIKKLPDLRAILVEKPLGGTYQESLEFLEECNSREIIVQVNFWRRGDEFFRSLSQGGLEKRIGKPEAAFGLYGNGLINNGSHMIDFVRMLCGDIRRAEVICPEASFVEGPIPNDRNVSFLLSVRSGLNVIFQAIPFGPYREISLDIWGERGRLGLYQESLGIYLYTRRKNRGLSGEWEISSDKPKIFDSTCGYALYRMYDNLAESLLNGEPLWSPGKTALETEKIIHELLNAV
jgi:predicted dehydrogenase